jgi:TAT (twin-arginine translocation) pathway signal sequence
MGISRRNVLKGGAGAAVLAALGQDLPNPLHDRALGEQLIEARDFPEAQGFGEAIRQANAQPGTANWLRPEIDTEVKRRIATGTLHRPGRQRSAPVAGIDVEIGRLVDGYADAMSVNTGESITLRVSSTMGAYVVAFLRLGWYSGDGAQEVYRSSALVGTAYPGSKYVSPGWNANGTVSCGWPAALTVATTGWTPGYYLASLIPISTGTPESYIPFVVRDDSSTASIVMQIPFTTYQAYNYWGGKNLYTGDDGAPAQVVSFDRPYDDLGGTGHLFNGDHQVLSWLEKNGYPVTYVASGDTHRRPGLMNGRKVFLSVYHDEYWSQSMRNNMVSWIGLGKSLAMFSANNIYWRIRFDNNAAGLPDRLMSCFKGYPEASTEKSILFSDLGQSEANIEGVEFAGAAYDDSDWVVTNANHWIYANTGLQNGDHLAGVIGGEWDKAVAQTPSDTTTIASTPKLSIDFGQTLASSVVRDVASGATVFAASTLKLGLFFGGAYSIREDPHVTKIAANLFAHVEISPLPPGDSYVPITSARLLDTRSTPPVGQLLFSGATRTIQVTGVAGVPIGASAAVLNVAAVSPSAAGHLRVFPAGAPLPNASVLNFAAGRNTPNQVIVKIGTGGQVSIYAGNTTHVLVDIAGYFIANDGDQYSPIATPTRITSVTIPGAVVGNPDASTVNVTVLGVGGIPLVGVQPISQVAVNVAATVPTATGHLRVFPTGTALPPTSTNNFVAGDSRRNLVFVAPGTGGQISIYNASSGPLTLSVDTVGYFTRGGLGFKPVVPVRPLDTRTGGSPVGGFANVGVQILGFGPVPNSTRVRAVVVNVAAVNPIADGIVEVGALAAGPFLPALSHPPGENVANLTIVPIGPDGKIWLRNYSPESSHLIVDITGYFSA